jgi:hypothetical protein
VNNSRFRCLFSLCLLLIAVVPPAWSADAKKVLEKANQTYYNLKAHGFAGFSCQASPDFDAAYKDMTMDEAGRAQVLPAAKKIRFDLLVGPTGAALVSHQFAEAPPSEEIADRIRKTASGMDQILSGFFQTWSSIMVNSPFGGADSDYRAEQLPNGHRLVTDSGKTQITLTMDHKFVLTLIEVKSPELAATLHPQFEAHEGGLVLQSYEATYQGNGSTQELSVKIVYQDLDGLALPRGVEAVTITPQGRVDAPIHFTGCQVRKH